MFHYEQAKGKLLTLEGITGQQAFRLESRLLASVLEVVTETHISSVCDGASGRHRQQSKLIDSPVLFLFLTGRSRDGDTTCMQAAAADEALR